MGAVGDLDAVEVDFAGGRLFQEVEAAQEGAFARTGRPDDYHHLAALDALVDALEYG